MRAAQGRKRKTSGGKGLQARGFWSFARPAMYWTEMSYVRGRWHGPCIVHGRAAHRTRAYGLDAQQSDAVASAGGICGDQFIWPRRVDEPAGRGADGGVDRTGCVGRTPGADAED